MSSVSIPPEPKVLSDNPTDGVTALAFLSPSLLASTSWDGTLRIHNVADQTLQCAQTVTEAGPLLSMAVHGNYSHQNDRPEETSTLATVPPIYVGGLDGSIRRFDAHAAGSRLANGNDDNNSQKNPCLLSRHHKAAVSCLQWIPHAQGAWLVSAGWDGFLYLWDPTAIADTEVAKLPPPLATLSLPGKAFSMDVHTSESRTLSRIVVACAGRRVCVVQVTTSTGTEGSHETHTAPGLLPQVELVLDRESTLKYQTRCVRFLQDGVGIALASIEGRVAIEYFEELDIPAEGKKAYTFKCHRDGDMVYPVNCLAFHPVHGTFATGGCDGTVGTYVGGIQVAAAVVCVETVCSRVGFLFFFVFTRRTTVTWDGSNKKKLVALPKFPTSIAALAFSPDGSQLAIASSYTFEDGEREHPRDEIYIRAVLDSEVLPKRKQ
jgi:cell cycle arrest protein BUB3